jgi:hypothetical protein
VTDHAAEHEQEVSRPARGPQPADGAAPLAALPALAAAMGNQAFAAAARSGRVRPDGVTRAAAAVARDPDPPAATDPPPIPEATLRKAEDRIVPELNAIADAIEELSAPTPKDWRELRQRVVAVRADFDSVPTPPVEQFAAYDNWLAARSLTAFVRELIDQQLSNGSDALLRMAWGKSFGTCRQLVGILRNSQPVEGAPAPETFADTMEFELCPRIERAIGQIPDIVEHLTGEELAKTRQELADLPQRIIDASFGEPFGHVAAVEFQKGLELIEQATRPPGEEGKQMVERLRAAGERAGDLESSHDSIFAPAPKGPIPAPSPNPLPPPPPPPPGSSD